MHPDTALVRWRAERHWVWVVVLRGSAAPSLATGNARRGISVLPGLRAHWEEQYSRLPFYRL